MKCPECGSEVAPDEKFCGNCGAPLPDGEPAPEAPDEAPPAGETIVAEAPFTTEEPIVAETPFATEEPVEPEDLPPLSAPHVEALPEPPPPAPPVPAAPVTTGNRKTVWIILAVVAAVLLCCCCCAAILVITFSADIESALQGVSMALPHVSAGV
ncbi:MAG: zinc ribbon domain-containing protein [Anaerolineae bacterium]|nr:zinc ribbon domain-containing protein [Anaerolineae bacterium]